MSKGNKNEIYLGIVVTFHKIKPPLKVVGEFRNHISINDSLSLSNRISYRNIALGHTLRAPRPYFYESGIYLFQLLETADNMTMLYPNTDANIEPLTAPRL